MGISSTVSTVSCAHPVFSPPAWERLHGVADRARREGWRFHVVGTSSIQHPDPPAWYLSYELEPLLSQVIRHINARGSVTQVQQADEPT